MKPPPQPPQTRLWERELFTPRTSAPLLWLIPTSPSLPPSLRWRTEDPHCGGRGLHKLLPVDCLRTPQAADGFKSLTCSFLRQPFIFKSYALLTSMQSWFYLAVIFVNCFYLSLTVSTECLRLDALKPRMDMHLYIYKKKNCRDNDKCWSQINAFIDLRLLWSNGPCHVVVLFKEAECVFHWHWLSTEGGVTDRGCSQ